MDQLIERVLAVGPRLAPVNRPGRISHLGAIERHMVFPNNDRPGIMLASAAREYLNHYGVAVGAKVGVYTAHDSAYEAACSAGMLWREEDATNEAAALLREFAATQP